MILDNIGGLRDHVLAKGYAVVRRCAPGISTEQLAASVGKPTEAWPGAVLQHLVPQATSTPNTYSGIFGLRSFPFHTDLAHWPVPPRFLLLRCRKGYAEMPTLLLDGTVIAATIGDDVLSRAVVIPRRPLAGKMRLLRLLDRRNAVAAIRWDDVFLKPASDVGRKAFEAMRDVIGSLTPESVALVDQGDTMVVDNWRMLHARTAASPQHHDRHLERVYLETVG